MIYSAPPLSLFHKRTHARIHTCAHMHTYKSLSDSTISFSIPISQDVCVFNQTHICIYMYNHVSVHRSAFTYMRALALVPSCPLTRSVSLADSLFLRRTPGWRVDTSHELYKPCSLSFSSILSLSLSRPLSDAHTWMASSTNRPLSAHLTLCALHALFRSRTVSFSLSLTLSRTHT